MKPQTRTTAHLFIITAPSGAGKTTLLKKIMAAVPGLSFSVSHTTRPPRQSESNGKDYFFINRDTFNDMKNQGDFLECAEVHSNFYGTSLAAVRTNLETGIDTMLDIDVQGAEQVRISLPEAITIFILPPSLAELEKRLSGRGTDSPETVALRLNNARREIKAAKSFDFIIINDDLETAADMLRSVILSERCRQRRTASGQSLNLSWLDKSVKPE
ncbi:guanylate kinase [Thermodesulfobacteriota bacterium]